MSLTFNQYIFIFYKKSKGILMLNSTQKQELMTLTK
jgi:hypothetical protein